MKTTNSMNHFTRREFLATSSQAAAGLGLATAGLTDALGQPVRRVAPSDKVQIALIGCRGVGWANLNSHLKLPEVELVGLCDVDDSVLAEKGAEIEKRLGKKVPVYKDYRKLLENKDLDAVIIATPDHWHALQMIHACEAGKDVYVEKPIATYIEESLAMAKAAKRYQRVVQVGQQQRSGLHWQSAVDFIKSGKLGKIRSVRTWIFNFSRSVPMPVADGPVPAGVDYDTWLGPAPKRPFNEYRFHGFFRYFWDYAGGLMTDWGVHLLDVALWATGKTAPKSVVSIGGKYAYPDSMMETPDTQHTLYDFGDMSITWEHTFRAFQGAPFGRHHGVAFYGEHGCLVADRNNWEVMPEVEETTVSGPRRYRFEALPRQTARNDDRDAHAADFINCIKSRGRTICDIDTGAHIAILAQLGNIAQRLGRQVVWDPVSQSFPADAEAQLLAKAKYRAPWKLPVV
jgi:predicted dehydrogenase